MNKNLLNAVVGLLLVFLVVVSAQALIGTYHMRADLTENKIYSIHPVSKANLAALQDKLNINVYLSDKLPPELANIRRKIDDLLNEFRIYSNGRLSYTIRDPLGNEDLEKKAESEGVQKTQFLVLLEGVQSEMKGYMGISLTYRNKTERIPVLSQDMLPNLELELTKRILKLRQDKPITIGFSQGHGEVVEQAYQGFKGKLQENFAVQDVDLKMPTAIPENINTLVIQGPNIPFTEPDLYYLNQFQMRGGNVVLLMDVFKMDPGSPAVTKATHGLDKFLANIGLQFNQKLVVDRYYPIIGWQNMPVRYPLFVIATPGGVNHDLQPIQKIPGNVLFPWPGDLTEMAVPMGLSRSWVVKASPESWVLPGENYDISPRDELLAGTPDNKEHLLAELVKGKMPNLFPGKAPDGVTEAPGKLTAAQKESQVLVMTSGRVVQDQFAGGNYFNGVFMTNLLESMALGEGLGDIRARALDLPKLDMNELGKSVKIYTWVFSLLMPFLICLIWVLRTMAVNKSRREFERAYKP